MWFNARLLLEFNVYNDRIIDDLNRMMRADEEVKITIEKGVEINNGN